MFCNNRAIVPHGSRTLWIEWCVIGLAERTQLFGGFEFMRHLSPAVCDVTSHDWKPHAELEPLLYPRGYAIIWMQVGPLCTLPGSVSWRAVHHDFHLCDDFPLITLIAGRKSGGRSQSLPCHPPSSLDQSSSSIGPPTSNDRKPLSWRKLHWWIVSPILLQCFSCRKIREVA